MCFLERRRDLNDDDNNNNKHNKRCVHLLVVHKIQVISILIISLNVYIEVLYVYIYLYVYGEAHSCILHVILFYLNFAISHGWTVHRIRTCLNKISLAIIVGTFKSDTLFFFFYLPGDSANQHHIHNPAYKVHLIYTCEANDVHRRS